MAADQHPRVQVVIARILGLSCRGSFCLHWIQLLCENRKNKFTVKGGRLRRKSKGTSQVGDVDPHDLSEPPQRSDQKCQFAFHLSACRRVSLQFQLIGSLLERDNPGFTSSQVSREFDQLDVFPLQSGSIHPQINWLGLAYLGCGRVQPYKKLLDCGMELSILQESSLQPGLPQGRLLTHSVPLPVHRSKPGLHCLGSCWARCVLCQVGSNHVDAHRHALVAVELQKEFPMVLDDFLQLLDTCGHSGSQELAQCCRGVFKPMLQSPHVSLHLTPVSPPT